VKYSFLSDSSVSILYFLTTRKHASPPSPVPDENPDAQSRSILPARRRWVLLNKAGYTVLRHDIVGELTRRVMKLPSSINGTIREILPSEVTDGSTMIDRHLGVHRGDSVFGSPPVPVNIAVQTNRQPGR
jgi:hypothetical protein